jgi:transcriptional regulator with XRE-family HTH domain
MQKIDSAEADKLICKNLKSLRLTLGKSQQCFADILEITNQQYSKFETSQNSINASQLFLIAQEYSADMNQFFNENSFDTTKAKD